MWRKSVTLSCENMCNSNKYRKKVKEKSRQEKKKRALGTADKISDLLQDRN